MGELMQAGMVALLVVCVALLFIVLMVVIKRTGQGGQSEADQHELLEAIAQVRRESEASTQQSMRLLGDMLTQSQAQATAVQDRRLSELSQSLSLRQDALQKTVSDGLSGVDKRMADTALGSEQRLESIRQTMEQRLSRLQADNAQQLDKMRETVDEKLQKTLEERIGQSFSQVSERLEQVYRGLGEMQTLAIGVGDLKKVLSGVKTRGILGEVQLGAILEQILSQEQYEANIITKKGSANPVEYAVKMPGDEMGPVYLPIDAKFPADTYHALLVAYDTAQNDQVVAAQKLLERAIKSFAKDIRDKYIDPPHTTDFGVMFLPFEGLYAEVVRLGMLESLQRDYRITIAGPTTMAAYLNSLQMGFRTLALQKHSSEVWQVLGAVKTEFDKFAGVLSATQKQLETAHGRLDELIGVRTRQIQRKLKNIELLPDAQAKQLLALSDDLGEEEIEESEGVS